MGRLRLEDSVQETIVAYAGGNPGALTFLIELIKIKDNDFFVDFMTIDKMELYEDKLYMLWNDCCNRDMQKVISIFRLYRKGKIKQTDIEERIKNIGYGKSFDDFLENEKKCTCCGGLLGERPALSRRDGKTYICSECGYKEAMEDVERMFGKRKEMCS